MLRYAISDRQMFPGDEPGRQDALVAQTGRLLAEGVDVFQLRERDLPEPAMEALLRRIVEQRRSLPSATLKILLNGPPSVAAGAGADGVHLRGGSGERDLESVRQTFHTAGLAQPIVSVSCHSVAEARTAALAGFDSILFGPVFEKRVHGEIVALGLGLPRLRDAVQAAHPARMIALGGVTAWNTAQCLQAGAAGVAGIRLFLHSAVDPNSYSGQ